MLKKKFDSGELEDGLVENIDENHAIINMGLTSSSA